MKAKVLFISLIGASIGVTLFFGKFISNTFLRTPIKIAGMTSDHPGSAAIYLNPDTFTSGVVAHEMIHGFKNFKIVARDIPFAAAVEYFHDYHRGEIRDHKILRTIESVIESQRRVKAKLDSSEYYHYTFCQIDSIASKNLTRLESAKTYIDAARIAGLSLSLETKPFFLTQMAIGAPASMAWKSLNDSRFEKFIDAVSWSRFFHGQTVTHPDLLERAYQFCLFSSPEDILDLEDFLSIRTIVDSAYVRHVASSVTYLLHRIRREDFNKVYQLGSETDVRTTKSDTSGYREGIVVRWEQSVPVFRLNSKMKTDSIFLFEDSLFSYLHGTLQEIQDIMRRDSIKLEIGEFDRNVFEKGYVFIQPSNLIPNEAMTTVQIENYQIVSAIITFNSNINYPPIIAQEIWHSIGMLGHVSPGSFNSIFQNHLPRPLPYFQNPSYEHFLSK